MNIGLINTYSTYNIGDYAIYSALQQLLASHQVNAVFSDDKPYPINGITSVDQLPISDYYISVGGDIFNNPRKHFVTRRFISNLRQLLHAPKQTILFGQSIPRSCRGLSFFLLCQSLRRLSSVVVRDQESYQRLQAAGVNVSLSYDTAFMLRRNINADTEAAKCFKEMKLDSDNCVLISLREFDSLYAYDNTRFAKKITELCMGLIDAGKQPVLLIQADASSNDSDIAIASSIQSQLTNLPIINAFTHSDQISHYQYLQSLICHSGVVVAVRYHTAVLALAGGKVPYNLYYSNKGKDLSARLGIPGTDVSDFDPVSELPVLLSTQGQTFDSKAIRKCVMTDFYSALSSVDKEYAFAY